MQPILFTVVRFGNEIGLATSGWASTPSESVKDLSTLLTLQPYPRGRYKAGKAAKEFAFPIACS